MPTPLNTTQFPKESLLNKDFPKVVKAVGVHEGILKIGNNEECFSRLVITNFGSGEDLNKIQYENKTQNQQNIKQTGQTITPKIAYEAPEKKEKINAGANIKQKKSFVDKLELKHLDKTKAFKNILNLIKNFENSSETENETKSPLFYSAILGILGSLGFNKSMMKSGSVGMGMDTIQQVISDKEDSMKLFSYINKALELAKNGDISMPNEATQPSSFNSI
jgi:hypothetical protein